MGKILLMMQTTTSKLECRYVTRVTEQTSGNSEGLARTVVKGHHQTLKRWRRGGKLLLSWWCRRGGGKTVPGLILP